MIWKPAHVALMLLLLVLMVAQSRYHARWQRHRWPGTKAEIVAGPNAGRSGVITSDAPFDLWVTINTEPTEAERRAWVEKQTARFGYREWQIQSSATMRYWVSAWRWQVRWIPAEGRDAGGRMLTAPPR